MSNVKDEIGNKYGKLTVVERIESDKYGNARWKCRCDCGSFHTTKGASLRNGQCRSCGCIVGGKKRSGLAPLKRHYNAYRSGAKDRNLEFDITLREFKDLVSRDCYYCSTPPSIKVYAYHRTRYSKGIESDEYEVFNGIDRVDNDKGYILVNLVPCCSVCNSMKSDMNIKQFKKQIFKIVENLSYDG